MDIQLYNTLGREKQVFKPIEAGKAGMYCCGLTVYNYAHIGNLRAYIFEDLLKRTLLYNGYDVKHVMNITDVGHLQSDADEGEDKMELGSSREGKTAWELAEYYTKVFQKDLEALNILPPNIWCKATDHIKEQIELIKCLEEKGYTYKTSDGIYFDSSKFHDYGKLALLDIEGLEEGKRIAFSEEKKNKIDFALWKFSPKGQKRQMEWDSPWGVGFPGWHIECSAMSMKYLGKTFDIHCGGVDHIPIHHTNEIAQSEACTGQKFVNYWLHNEFLIIESEKMSKSSGEFLRLQTLIDKGYDPLDYRYFCLGTHYRKHLQFTWENLDAAKNAYERLKNRVIEFRTKDSTTDLKDYTESIDGYKQRFLEAVNDDLGIPEGLAVMWEVVRNDLLPPNVRLELLYEFDNVLGLGLKDVKNKSRDDIPDEILKLVEERTTAKKNKDFKKADEIRNKIKEMGYELVDKKDGVEVKKIQK
ncbi:MAG: cysteine--tRNA ligase [Ignavibacteria bacterium]|jgi:cysteinyl-tRNA synthetase